jgi:hypothetical protein
MDEFTTCEQLVTLTMTRQKHQRTGSAKSRSSVIIGGNEANTQTPIPDPTSTPTPSTTTTTTTITKAPLYKDSSTETLSIASPHIVPRVTLNDTPLSTRKYGTVASSPTFSTGSSIKSPVPVRQNVWMNRTVSNHRTLDAERQMNWLNGSAGKRENLRFDENNMIIKTNTNGNKSDEEDKSSKICLLFKPGSNHSGKISCRGVKLKLIRCQFHQHFKRSFFI